VNDFRPERVALATPGGCVMCPKQTMHGEVLDGADVAWCWACWSAYFFESKQPLRVLVGGRAA
jgi:hypothetical protein